MRGTPERNSGEVVAVKALTTLTWAALIVPPLLLGYAALTNYRSLEELIDRRIEGTLDVLHEHSLKVLQTTERLLFEAETIVRSVRQSSTVSDQQIAHVA